jgi:hypothetical protein
MAEPSAKERVQNTRRGEYRANFLTGRRRVREEHHQRALARASSSRSLALTVHYGLPAGRPLLRLRVLESHLCCSWMRRATCPGDRRWGELRPGAQRAQRGQRLQPEVTDTPRLTRLRSRFRCPPGRTILAYPPFAGPVAVRHPKVSKAPLDVSTSPCASSPALPATCSGLWN